jgi:hypothetical protein
VTEGFAQCLLTGGYSSPRRSRATSPLDDKKGIFVQVAQQNLVQILVIDHDIGNFLANSGGSFFPRCTRSALLLALEKGTDQQKHEQRKENKGYVSFLRRLFPLRINYFWIVLGIEIKNNVIGFFFTQLCIFFYRTKGVIPDNVMNEDREYPSKKPPAQLREKTIALFKIVCRVNDEPVIPIFGRLYFEQKFSSIGELLAHLVIQNLIRHHLFELHVNRNGQKFEAVSDSRIDLVGSPGNPLYPNSPEVHVASSVISELA